MEVGDVAVAVTVVGTGGGIGITGVAMFENPDWPDALVALTS